MDSGLTGLAAEAAELEKKINALMAQPGGGTDALMARWALNTTQARVIASLADGSVYSIADIAALIARSGDGNLMTARTELHRIRNKIAPVQIRSIHGRGYRLDEPHLSTVLRIMGGSNG